MADRSASIKQVRYLEELFTKLQEYLTRIPEVARIAVAEKLADHAETLGRMNSGQDLSLQAAGDAITALREIVEDYTLEEEKIRWAKFDDLWVVKGPQGVMAEGETVTVQSRRGPQQVKLGPLVSSLADGYAAYEVAPEEVVEGTFIADREGVYRNADGTVIRAYLTKKGILVAQTLPEKEYLGQRGLKNITEALSFETVQQLGWDWTMCCCCGRKLTNPESKELGMGPHCRSKFFGGDVPLAHPDYVEDPF